MAHPALWISCLELYPRDLVPGRGVDSLVGSTGSGFRWRGGLLPGTLPTRLTPAPRGGGCCRPLLNPALAEGQQVTMSAVNCKGTEATLLQCESSGWGHVPGYCAGPAYAAYAYCFSSGRLPNTTTDHCEIVRVWESGTRARDGTLLLRERTKQTFRCKQRSCRTTPKYFAVFTTILSFVTPKYFAVF